MRLLILVTSILFYSATAIFEDQVGKFDWRRKLVGCPENVLFDRRGRESDRLIVTTDQSVIASLAVNTGKIAWRRIMEESDTVSKSLTFTDSKDYLYSTTNDGRSLRVWRKSDGVLAQQFPISDEITSKHAIHQIGNIVLVSTEKRVVSISLDSGKVLQTVASTSEKTFASFFRKNDALGYVYTTPESNKLNIVPISENGNFGESVELDFVAFDSNRCRNANHHFTCFHGKRLTTANVINLKTSAADVDFEIERVSVFDGVVVAHGNSKIALFTVLDEGLSLKKILDADPSEQLGLVEKQEALVLVSSDVVRVIPLNGQSVLSLRLPDAVRASPKRVFASSTSSSEYDIVIVGQDCRVELVSLDVPNKQINQEWSTEESLINIAAVEMVDLPLSESQQMIEDEFEELESGNILSAFVRRIHVQIGQLCRSIRKSLENVVYVFASISKNGNGLSDFISSIRSVSNSIDATTFERDYFNLRKVIIATTIDGTVFGIDSNSGGILWKIWLGNSFIPLESDLGNRRVPLFVQRTTAHYQLHGLASVAYSDKVTRNGVIVTINPIIGKIVSTKELDYPIKRMTLLPVTDQKHVHPIITIGRGNQIDITPAISVEELESCTSLYLMDLDTKTNSARGLKVNLADKKLEVVWTGNLGLGKNDEVVAVKGKPYNQKVHSQGRVLISRDVQYKYVNPNLAAVASLDKNAQHLTIILVDIVTGQIVHSASVGKVGGPIHLVHSENWIAYTYWSEKGRRTELGIIELYEGSSEQSQKVLFDSKLLNKEVPVVMSQSYIYAQGISAMSISETEQGLTTRSLLLAHPSGNIHEVSRRLLDATRPLEVTQAMREEMIIGYMPEIAVGMEEMINYNQTVHRVRGMKTSPSGLESTTLFLAYGTDLFFTRLVPSGTFDILKDDFDHVLISIVLTGLILGAYVTKRWARSNALAAQWS